MTYQSIEIQIEPYIAGQLAAPIDGRMVPHSTAYPEVL